MNCDLKIFEALTKLTEGEGEKYFRERESTLNK